MITFGSDEYRAERIKKNTPGFTLVEYAFHDAVGRYEKLVGETPDLDKSFYLWSPLSATRKPEDIPTWEGSPEQAQKIMIKTAKYFGAVGVGFRELD